MWYFAYAASKPESSDRCRGWLQAGPSCRDPGRPSAVDPEVDKAAHSVSQAPGILDLTAQTSGQQSTSPAISAVSLGFFLLRFFVRLICLTWCLCLDSACGRQLLRTTSCFSSVAISEITVLLLAEPFSFLLQSHSPAPQQQTGCERQAETKSSAQPHAGNILQYVLQEPCRGESFLPLLSPGCRPCVFSQIKSHLES